MTELHISNDDNGEKSFERKLIPPIANFAHFTLWLLAYNLGRISPKRSIKKVSITVCKMKLNTGGIFANMGPNAKLHNITIVTLTVLLAINIVAKSLSGVDKNFLIGAPLGVWSRSSSCAGVKEKNDISLPEINPDMSRQHAAIAKATISPIPKVVWARRAVAGKGSISKIKIIS